MASTLNQADTSSGVIRTGRYRVPDNQRKRVRTACENCRRNKLRCDGAQPCMRCSELDKRCRYTPKSTGGRRHVTGDRACGESETVVQVQAEDEVQMMKEILAIQHPKAVESLEGLRALRETLTSDYQGSQRPSSVQMQNSASALIPTNISPRAYVPCHHVEEQEQAADAHVSSIRIFDQGKTRYEGNSSLWAFFDAARRFSTTGVENPQPDDEDEETVCSGTMNHPMSIHRFGTDLKNVVLMALPPKGVVEFLSSTFFRLAQSNYFCIHPEIYYRKLKSFYDSGEDLGGQDPQGHQRTTEFISLLFMVLAIGAQFADVGTTSDQGCDNIDWNLYERSPSLLSQLVIPMTKQNPGWGFCEVSRKLLPDVVCSSSMASIQVCVLQGIFLPSTGSRDAGYNLLGLALRMAINMGLHRSVRCKQLHPQVRELRNRLWWTVYVAERMYSIEMGRPLAISDSEIDAAYPLDSMDQSYSKQITHGVGGLIAMIDICKILGKIVQTVYCEAASADGTVMRPTVMRQLKNDLNRWKRELPAALCLHTLPFRRSVAHLALSYDQAMILLTRPCLLAAILPDQPLVLPNDQTRRFLQQQAQDCVAAASSSINLLLRLKSESLLCPFSFHDGPYCSSALHVLHLANQRPDVVPGVQRKDILQGLSVLIDLAKGSKLAAANLRHIAHAIAAAASTGESGLRNLSRTGDLLRDQHHSDEKGRGEWRDWVARSATSNNTNPNPLVFNGEDGASFSSEFVSSHEAPTLQDFQSNSQGTGYQQHISASAELGSQSHVALVHPVDANENWITSDSWDHTSFIISGISEYDILERDWGYLSDIS